MRLPSDEPTLCGRTAWERVAWGAASLLRSGRFGGKAFLGPETFQTVQWQLTQLRDPTLRAEWDGNRCYLRVAICGRELVVHMREDLPEGDVVLDEKSMVKGPF